MKLIIAEKPSLARNILAGIARLQNDQMAKRDGYYEGGDYVVTWVFGHLFSLADIEDYVPNPQPKWTMDNLPCFPDKFKFNLKRNANKEIDPGVKKQFNTIKYLCNRANIDTIVNAGDADREGEIIVRLCVEHALESQKNFVRLWLPDQTPETISEALDAFFLDRDREQRVKQRAADILRMLTNAEARLIKKIDSQEKELADCEKGEQYKKLGDLITANMYLLKRGDKSVEVVDYDAWDEVELIL